MLEYWIAYRDVEGYEPRGSFEVMEPPPADMGMVAEQIVVRGFREKDIYIRWHHWVLDPIRLHLLTCTQHELTVDEVKALALQAVKFGQEQNR